MRYQPYTESEVLALIAPCDPDNLTYIGNGEYRATFIPGFGPMDIEILRATPGVVITKEAHEPAHLVLPGWIAVHFALEPDIVNGVFMDDHEG